MKAIVIFSGGVDSTTCLYRAMKENDKVFAIGFDYGQKHKKELECAKMICKKLNVDYKIIDISNISKELMSNSALISEDIKVPEGHYEEKNMTATFVPNRNMIFLSLAIGYAVNIKAQRIYIGVHSGDHQIYPDTRPEFIDLMQKIAIIANYDKIDIIAPYLFVEKSKIIREGLRLGVPYELTWSCYKGGKVPCGKCGTCTERLEAFAKNGVDDPLNYKLEKKK